ncbi:hypothetical protein ARALYDRAFT_489981 [Arabidopsis lyrata subsp. lyrata]|uniref:FHA domain-containing protein n=1 Tax=Arabidopsis lyrata subsp. lyrata TaxID=81972 RepID=D7LZN0_ARALL|nr:hypothetical protein ARALYDRAFT_489981 [Arabidopsis lyrata subsp. lyrata]
MTTSQSKKSKIENNSQSLEISREKNFNDVPLDVAMEIFMRLPVKSVVRFLLLSKSSLQSRLLVVFIDLDRQRNCENWYFFSLSSSSTSYLSRVTCLSPDYVYYTYYVNGLISFGYGLEKYIANPSTGNPSTVLGRVQTRSTVAHSFFGKKCNVMMVELEYYKLQLSSQHQVVTLGIEKKQWRMIDYRTPHGPVLNSVCIDGVIYYVAFTGTDLSQLSLMRFDLGSEKLDLFTSLSADFPAAFLHGFNLMSYKGKVALATKTSFNEFEVWILDQQVETHGWLKKSFSIKGKKLLYSGLFITGTTHTGEFVLALRFYSNNFYVIYYNPDTKSFRKTKVQVHADYEFKHRETKAMFFRIM